MKSVLFGMIVGTVIGLVSADCAQAFDTDLNGSVVAAAEIGPNSAADKDPWNLDPQGDPFLEPVAPPSLSLLPSGGSPNLEPQLYLAEAQLVAGNHSQPGPEGNASAGLNRPDSDRWRFEITPYMWAPALKGGLKVNDRGSDYDLEASDMVDLLDEAEMMAMVNLKAKKKRTSFFVDFIYSKMDSISTGDLNLDLPAVAQNDLDLTWEEMFIQFGAGYTLCEFATPAGRKASFDIQGGGRYLYVSGDDEIVGGPMDRIRIGIDGSENFVEPWIGAMLEAELSNCTSLVIGGDIGGFGHGEAVGTNWQYYAKLLYHITPQWSLDAGFRHMKLEYEDSLKGRTFSFEQEAYGPVVGLTFKF